MTPSRPPRFSVRQVLDDVENAAPVAAVEAVTRNIAAAVGAVEASLLIAGVTGRDLVRLTHTTLVDQATVSDPTGETTRSSARERATTLSVDTGPPAEALGRRAVTVVPPGRWPEGCPADAGHWVVLAPVIERGEALGLLQLCLPEEPDPELTAEIAETGHLLAYVVIASRRHTDVYEWGQRTAAFSLSAEIQRRLLPAAHICETGSFTLAAWLEPAASVGGDTFDYSVDRDVLHLGMTDARGHGVGSALTATLTVGALRNARREGATLTGQAGSANEALLEHPGNVGEDFCTGLIGRLDLARGTLALVNAGHPLPYLVRDGSVRTVDLPEHLPFGVLPSTGYTSTDLALQPGDRVVLVTDGMLERNATTLDLPDLLQQTRGLHPRTATRALADLVLQAVGHELADDATLLVLDWHGDHGEERTTTAGAGSP
ncbi:PP2C family protein-serine/threonine phosphatase [Aquipuribacter sp. MA13-6]|uniref:PP2C family protein-serine/threonine phosphatase n=1 Tax=unclassified Aquipuribacter TaxID=2635084 RepID=UPI003EEDFBD5